MDDSSGRLNIIPDHFQVSTSGEETPQTINSSAQQPKIDNSSRSSSHFWSGRKLRSAVFMLNLFSLRRLSWGYSTNGQEKVELRVVELESLRSELACVEEREAHLKAQLQHADEILRSARFSGYLYIRTRWTALPGEPPPLDDADVDDWLPRFVVLNGPCIFFYLLCTDLSPQDSTLLSDIVEVGSLPSLARESDETWHSFYILTRQGLRYECSSISEVQVDVLCPPLHPQVDSWLKVLMTDIKPGSETKVSNGSGDV
ncbi:hypothetical protein DKX38_004664 [Salix brachista]|uniref:PH domain-containing protein n=1 Tax=Salix brachista TaxID=2182728 RepID=A0A5N5NAI2_9ROSI|nr:hypothetical protein DKX38_004664 [Salix brachista]